MRRQSPSHVDARAAVCTGDLTGNPCSRGYFRARGKCQACSRRCSHCSDVLTCAACEDGYYKGLNGSCQACPHSCKACVDASTCATCNAERGYYKNPAGVCEAKCVFDELVGTIPEWPLQLQARERKVYSQNGEDGILVFIFQNVGVTNKFYVEFGVETGMERNTRYLQELCGWHGHLMDGTHSNPSINLTRAFISSGNIGKLFKERGVPADFDLLSIDLDSTDLWIWRKLGTVHGYRPRVVVIEVNRNYAKDEFWSFPDRTDVAWLGDCLMGASLAAMDLLSKELGYTLVGVDSRFINAFFVRSDVLHKSGATARDLSVLHPEPQPLHAPCTEDRKKLRVDYRLWHQVRELDTH